jgi:hypothetical protein
MSKNNLILAIAFLAQVVLILGMRLGGEESAIPKSSAFLEGYDADKVTKLEILGPPKEGDGPDQPKVSLHKAGTAWGIADADDFPADETKVKDFLKSLGKMRVRSVVVTSSKYHDKLEVSEKKYQKKVTITQDGKDTTFFVGSSPSFKNLHVRRDGSDEVLLANEVSSGDISDRAWGWVDRTYVKYDKPNVWSVKIQNEKGAIDLERNVADDSWSVPGMTEPIKKSVMEDLIRKASQINLEEPVGKELKPEYGLGAATIMLITGTSTIAGVAPKATESTTIEIGKKIEKENRYYVKASSSDYVVKAASWAIDPLVQKTRKDLIEEPKKDPAPKK